MQLQLSRTASLLAEIPTLESADDAPSDAPTIQDGSTPFWRLAGSDLFLLADPGGHVVALDVTQAGLDPARRRGIWETPCKTRQDSAWWYSGGRLYWVFLRPILAGVGSNAKRLGLVAIGYELNSRIAEQLGVVAESKIVFAGSDKIIASTFSPEEEAVMQGRILGAEAVLRSAGTGGHLERQRIPGGKGHAARRPAFARGVLRVHLSAPSDGFIRQLNRTILVVGISAVLLACCCLSSALSRARSLAPLDNLVAGVRALAAGDYTYSITPRGSSEAVELAESFSKMRGELLAFQKKQIETERVAAVGRAANSISHDLRHHLAALVANAEFLYEAEKLRLDRDEVYREIQTASEQMTELLDSLRDLAREQRNISPVNASIDQCVRRAIEAARSRPELRNREFPIHMRRAI